MALNFSDNFLQTLRYEDEPEQPVIPDIEKDTLSEAFTKGILRGGQQLYEGAGSALQYLGNRIGSPGLKEFGKEQAVRGKEVGEWFDPSQDIAKSYFGENATDRPGTKLAYDIANMGVSMAPALIAAGATMGSSLIPQTVSRLAASLVGGAIGGLQEGTSTYQEMIKRGTPESDAARGLEAMSLGAGLLNAISLGKILSKSSGGVIGAIKKGLASGATEATTEYLEEPLEVVIKKGLLKPEQFTDKEVKEQLIGGLDVMPASFVLGALAGGIAGFNRPTPPPPHPTAREFSRAPADEKAAYQEYFERPAVDPALLTSEANVFYNDLIAKKASPDQQLTGDERNLISLFSQIKDNPRELARLYGLRLPMRNEAPAAPETIAEYLNKKRIEREAAQESATQEQTTQLSEQQTSPRRLFSMADLESQGIPTRPINIQSPANPLGGYPSDLEAAQLAAQNQAFDEAQREMTGDIEAAKILKQQVPREIAKEREAANIRGMEEGLNEMVGVAGNVEPTPETVTTTPATAETVTEEIKQPVPVEAAMEGKAEEKAVAETPVLSALNTETVNVEPIIAIEPAKTEVTELAVKSLPPAVADTISMYSRKPATRVSEAQLQNVAKTVGAEVFVDRGAFGIDRVRVRIGNEQKGFRNIKSANDYLLEEIKKSLLPKSRTETALSIVSAIYNQAKTNPAGFTIDISDGSMVEKGYAVAPAKETATVFDELTEQDVREFLRKFKSVFDSDERAFFGGWMADDPKSPDYGKFVLDVSFVVDNFEDAAYIADIGEQDGIYHIDGPDPEARYIRTEDAIRALKERGVYDEGKRTKLAGIRGRLREIIEGEGTAKTFKSGTPAHSRAVLDNGRVSSQRRTSGQSTQGNLPAPVQVTGVHFSKEQRPVLSTSYAGTNYAGAEKTRLSTAPKEIQPRLYIYANVGYGINPEVGVGPHAHKLTIDNLFDIRAGGLDYEILPGENSNNAFEIAILKAGYNGWFDRASGVICVLGKQKLTPEYLGVNRESYANIPQAPPMKVTREMELNEILSNSDKVLQGSISGPRWVNEIKENHPDIYPELEAMGIIEALKNYLGTLNRREIMGVKRVKPGKYSRSEERRLDQAYLDAVNRGDIETAQKMVDEAAKKAGYVIRAYRGTVEKGETILPKSFEAGGGIFTTNNPDVAEIFRYEREHGEVLTEYYNEETGEYEDVEPGDLQNLYVKIDNPLILNENSAVDPQQFVYETPLQSRIIKQAIAEGHDGIIVEDVEEGVGDWMENGTTYIIFKSNQAKSADPVTYDNQGNVIPLSERFNLSDDIRYLRNRQQPSQQLSKAELQAVANDLFGNARNRPDVVVVDNVSDLPFDAMEDAEGVFYDGKIYLVSSNVPTIEDAKRVIFHELVGHYGLRGFFGSKLDPSLDLIYNNNPLIRQYAITWMKNNRDLQLRYGISDLDYHYRAIEEAMARMAQQNKPFSFAKRLLSTIQSLLRKIGLNKLANALEARSNAEALAILNKSRLYINKGVTIDSKMPASVYAYFSRVSDSVDNAENVAPKSEEESLETTRNRNITGTEPPHATAPPPTAPPEQIFSWIKDNSRYTLSQFKQMLPKNTPELSVIERLLASPEWYQHPVFRNLVDLFSNQRHDIANRIFQDNEMINPAMPVSDKNSLIAAANDLKHKGLSKTEIFMGKNSREYDALKWVINYGDAEYVRNHKEPLATQIEEFKNHVREKLSKQGFTSAQIDEIMNIWKLFRRSYDNYLDLMMAPMIEMSNKIKYASKSEGKESDLYKKLDTDLGYMINKMNSLRGFYAPRERLPGKWVVYGKKGEGEQEKRFREHVGTRFEAEKIKDRYERMGYTVQPITEYNQMPEIVMQNLRQTHITQAIKNAIQAEESKSKGDKDKIDLLHKLNKGILEQVSDIIKARGYLSSKMSRITEHHITGYIEDPIERYLIYARNTSNGLAKSQVAQVAYDILRNIDPMKSADENRLYNAASKYIEDNLRNIDKADRLVALAKSVATMKYLALNPRSLLVNATAVATTAPAAIHQYATDGKIGLHKIVASLAKAGADFGKFMAGNRNFSKEEQQFLDDLIRSHYDNPQYTKDVMGNLQGSGSKLWNAALRWGMVPFSLSERWNRGTTMLSAFRLARSQGKSYEEASKLARIASDKAHGIYGKATLPEIAQGTSLVSRAAQMMYSYAKFGHNYVQMLYDLGFRKHNLQAFAYALLSPVILAGGAALPFKDNIVYTVNWILKFLGIKEDAEKWWWDQTRKYFGKEGEKLGRHGLIGYMGADISSSLSINLGIPDTYSKLAGPAGGVAEDISSVKKYVQTGEYSKAAESVLPTAVANLLRAYRERQEGVTSRQGRRLWDESGQPFMPTVGQSLLRATGFRPSEQAMLQERKFESQRVYDTFKETHDDILEAIRAYYISPAKDPAKMARIVDQIEKYNQQITSLGLVNQVPLITRNSIITQLRGVSAPKKKEMARLQSQTL